MKMTTYDRLTCVLLCGLALWMAFFSLYQNKSISDDDGNLVDNRLVLFSYSNNTFFTATVTNEEQEIESEIQEIEKTLEFMVWPDERENLLRHAIDLTQKLIIKDPTETNHWKRLLPLQYEYSPEPNAIFWILDKIYKLNGWNNRVLINLSRYCVPFVFDDGISVPVVCTKIIRQLSSEYEEVRLASLIGISIEDLNTVLSQNKELQ